jgi:hypothetical protein
MSGSVILDYVAILVGVHDLDVILHRPSPVNEDTDEALSDRSGRSALSIVEPMKPGRNRTGSGGPPLNALDGSARTRLRCAGGMDRNEDPSIGCLYPVAPCCV